MVWHIKCETNEWSGMKWEEGIGEKKKKAKRKSEKKKEKKKKKCRLPIGHVLERFRSVRNFDLARSIVFVRSQSHSKFCLCRCRFHWNGSGRTVRNPEEHFAVVKGIVSAKYGPRQNANNGTRFPVHKLDVWYFARSIARSDHGEWMRRGRMDIWRFDACPCIHNDQIDVIVINL